MNHLPYFVATLAVVAGLGFAIGAGFHLVFNFLGVK